MTRAGQGSLRRRCGERRRRRASAAFCRPLLGGGWRDDICFLADADAAGGEWGWVVVGVVEPQHQRDAESMQGACVEVSAVLAPPVHVDGALTGGEVGAGRVDEEDLGRYDGEDGAGLVAADTLGQCDTLRCRNRYREYLSSRMNLLVCETGCQACIVGTLIQSRHLAQQKALSQASNDSPHDGG